MKLLPYTAFIMCMLLITPNKGFADNVAANTGNELINYCNDANQSEQNEGWMLCVMYVNGVSDGYPDGVLMAISLAASMKHLDGDTADKWQRIVVGYCAPDNATRNQYALVVTKYLKDHPANLNMPDYLLVLDALKKAWPCPDSEIPLKKH